MTDSATTHALDMSDLSAEQSYEVLSLAISKGVEEYVHQTLTALSNKEKFQSLVKDQAAKDQADEATKRLAELDDQVLYDIYSNWRNQFTGLDCALSWNNSTGRVKRTLNSVRPIVYTDTSDWSVGASFSGFGFGAGIKIEV